MPIGISSYEPGNRAGSVTGMNFGKFQPGYRDKIQKTNPKWRHINEYRSRLSTLVTLMIKLIQIILKWEFIHGKIMPFWPPSFESEANLSKTFCPGNWAAVFIWENCHPACRDLGCRNRDLGNRVGPPSHMNTSQFLQRK